MYIIYAQYAEDVRWAPLDYNGVPTMVFKDVGTYATKEDAEEFLSKHRLKDGYVVQIKEIK